MNDTYHSDRFPCGDAAALVTYLYDECEPGERAAIAAHVSTCAACAEEIASLDATRTQLAAWTPPEADLGFQMTRNGDAAAPQSATVLRPARWWSRPLPAWAQAAAAALIFASGMAIGIARQNEQSPAVATATTPVTATAVATPVAASVSPNDLAALERRLRNEMAQLRTVSGSATPAHAPTPDVLRRVETMIAESEQRQRREMALRTAEVVRDMDTQRRVDLAQVQRTVGQIQDLTGAAVRDQNDMFNYLVKVSQRR